MTSLTAEDIKLWYHLSPDIDRNLSIFSIDDGELYKSANKLCNLGYAIKKHIYTGVNSEYFTFWRTSAQLPLEYKIPLTDNLRTIYNKLYNNGSWQAKPFNIKIKDLMILENMNFISLHKNIWLWCYKTNNHIKLPIVCPDYLK